MKTIKLFWATLAHAGVVLLFMASSATACAICLSAMSLSNGQHLENADQAVLAQIDPSGAWQIVAQIKANGPLDLQGMSEDVTPKTDPTSGHVELLVRDSLGEHWSSLGAFNPEYTDWLTSLAAQPPLETFSDWQARLTLVAPHLEAGRLSVEEMAHGELARAPYAAFAFLNGMFTADELIARINVEDVASRRAAYILLLGMTDEASVVDFLNPRIEAAITTGDATDIAALLAAKLEILGPPFVQWVTQNMLLARDRSPADIEAGLLALAVHGDTDLTVPRSEVIEAYRAFINARPHMSGFVAAELMEWRDWSLSGDYAVLLENGALLDPASEYAITRYVQMSQDAVTDKELKEPNDQ
ncbi:hypothetical protein [Falsihalocynthiibacter arcticus]|uniref:DUF4375 domain-containing protein n=1 Tax=Falsihalocynthiibacter arcticus TaxID=1579316 RepID=A0A126V506_9RHOB|nr:hypothetical protein [Falsihalocynthiibacter arcticus]AML53404.1 hypothetical protein RC74_21010 [Falsihalocynthiibacter arcticus]